MLLEGLIPQGWKYSSNVNPIHKEGSHDDPGIPRKNGVQPVAILS